MNNYNPYGEQLSWQPTSEQQAYDPASEQAYYHYPRNSQQGKIGSTMQASRASYRSQQRDSHLPTRMSKEQALSMANRLKKLSLVASIALFGVFSGVIATHLQNSSGKASPTPLPPQGAPQGQPAQPANPADSNADSGSFFGHHHHDGYGFGDDNGNSNDNGNNNGNANNNGGVGSFQQPSTGTGVSRR